jgi:hypothetical protein
VSSWLADTYLRALLIQAHMFGQMLRGEPTSFPEELCRHTAEPPTATSGATPETVPEDDNSCSTGSVTGSEPLATTAE